VSFLFVLTDSDRILGTDAAGVTPTGAVWSEGSWLKLVSAHNGKFLAKWFDAGGNGGFETLLSVGSDRKIVAATFDGGFNIITGGTVLDLDTWYQVTLIQNGTGANTLTLYVNAVSDGTSATTAAPQNTTTPIKIGAGGNGGTEDEPFDGYISRPFFCNATAINGTQRTNLLTQDPDDALGAAVTWWTIKELNEVVEYVAGASVTNTGATFSTDEPFGGGGGTQAGPLVNSQRLKGLTGGALAA
jgi:hypothetical protein